jgi:hypothetical protein
MRANDCEASLRFLELHDPDNSGPERGYIARHTYRAQLIDRLQLSNCFNAVCESALSRVEKGWKLSGRVIWLARKHELADRKPSFRDDWEQTTY